MVERAPNINKQEVRNAVNHRGRGRTDTERRRDYAEYRARKRTVFSEERNNTDKLILFLASDGNDPAKKKKFYNMGDTSAFIYAYELAPRMNRGAVTLRSDDDLGADEIRFKKVCSIANIELFKEKMAELGCKLLEDSSREIVRFQLNRKYEKSELEQMQRANKDAKKEANQLLSVETLYPDIYKLLLLLRRIIQRKIWQLPADKRVSFEKRITDPIFDANEIYIKMTHDVLHEAEHAERILEDLDKVKAMTGMLMEEELWTVATAAEIGKYAAQASQLIKGKIINKAVKVDGVKKRDFNDKDKGAEQNEVKNERRRSFSERFRKLFVF